MNSCAMFVYVLVVIMVKGSNITVDTSVTRSEPKCKGEAYRLQQELVNKYDKVSTTCTKREVR